MALVHSSAAFKQRCMAFNHSGELWKGLAAEQVETFAQLAFVLGTPQGPPGQEQFGQLAGKVWGSPSLGDLAHLRLLLSEASTLAAARPEAPVFPATKEAPACSSSSATRAQPESFSIGPDRSGCNPPVGLADLCPQKPTEADYPELLREQFPCALHSRPATSIFAFWETLRANQAILYSCSFLAFSAHADAS